MQHAFASGGIRWLVVAWQVLSPSPRPTKAEIALICVVLFENQVLGPALAPSAAEHSCSTLALVVPSIRPCPGALALIMLSGRF